MPRQMRAPALTFILVALTSLQTGCGGSASSCPATMDPCTPPASRFLPSPLNARVKHVSIVVLENHCYAKVIGNTTDMPYLNSLSKTYACAKGYYANTHPSIGNYFMLTTGQIVTNDDGFSDMVTADNVVRQLIAARKTWKEYSQNLPFVGYTGGDTKGYTQHHNPLSYFSDVRNSKTEINNLVPFTQLAIDMANHTLPDYSFIVPTNKHNGHDCPAGISDCSDHDKLAAADSWLKDNIDPLIKSPDFSAPGGGLLIITFDESAKSDKADGGGHVAWVVVGADVKKGFTSTTCYQHESALRFMSGSIGLTDYPGAAATAPDMEEFISAN